MYIPGTIHAYAFPDTIATENVLKSRFARFGIVAIIRVVKVPGAVGSWALIAFSNSNSVARVIEESEDERMDKPGVWMKLRKTAYRISVARVTAEYIEDVDILKQKVLDAEFELQSRQTVDGYGMCCAV